MQSLKQFIVQLRKNPTEEKQKSYQLYHDSQTKFAVLSLRLQRPNLKLTGK